MKKLVIILVGIFFAVPLLAAHIRGGEMYYRYLGPGSNGASRYRVTLKLYVRCDATQQQLDPDVPFTVFRKSGNVQVQNVSAPLTDERFISYDPASNPCITNPPTDICYRMRFYETTIEVPDDPFGYTIAFQRCCRIAGIENVNPPSDNYGATYTCEIPGTNTLPSSQHNSSASVTGNDAVAICVGSNFTFDFSAVDPDPRDSLVYRLCEAYTGGSRGTPAPDPASRPPYGAIPYEFPYSAASPLGARASINSKTGLISGIAPLTAAQYVVTGCIYEYRDGVLINIHRKDIHIRVADCVPLSAVLKPNYDYCDDFLVSFKNEQTNPPGSVYIWDFGDGSKADTSNDAVGAVQHQFADTGTYSIKLTVILAGQCIDSTRTLAKVYPGFYPGFVSTGTCVLNPISFTDTTKTRYGSVNNWRWNFGDLSTNADTSLSQNPSWKYNSTGTKNVQLIVGSDKGCLDTVQLTIELKDKPNVSLAFKDTLICSIDTLQLSASGLGNFSWAPNSRILNANTPNPLVFPTTTTRYIVTLDENGCINQDTVNVRVVDFVTLGAGPDSTVCLTDSLILRPTGDGLAFSWTPIASLNNPNLKNPVARPTATTTYTVTARIGKCSATDAVEIKTVPYPGSFAGADTVICYRDTTQLNGSIIGSNFVWTPATGLNNSRILNPLAYPIRTTNYVLQAFDTLGCPKPGLDTVVVTVRPPVLAFAGNDTSVVVNQPLKLRATGAQIYLWTPATNLDRNDVQSPLALFNNSGTYTYYVRVSTPEDCFSGDTINIKVFSTAPDIYVPNAFTPDKVQNNLFRPIPVGISTIEFFRVYNRLGNLVFASTDGTGWDGKYAGKKQDAGSYVWVVQGKDYTGKTIFKKGTMVLIR